MAKKTGLAERFGLWFWAKTEGERRIARLVDAVYWRLPAHDRHVLRELIEDIRCDHPEGKAPPEIGMVEPPCMDTTANGIQAVYDDCALVNLTGTHQVRSDAAAMAVIAHEMAHVVLRHYQISLTAANLYQLPNLGVYTEAAMEALKECHEDHAWLQAWVWGFEEEIAAAFEEWPDAPRPRWYVNLAWERVAHPPRMG